LNCYLLPCAGSFSSNEPRPSVFFLCFTLGSAHVAFQFSSLLDTLIPPLEKQLERCYEAQEKALAGERGVLRSPTVPPGILADERKA